MPKDLDKSILCFSSIGKITHQHALWILQKTCQPNFSKSTSFNGQAAEGPKCTKFNMFFQNRQSNPSEIGKKSLKIEDKCKA